MPLQGRHGIGCIDYPTNVKDSVTVLPFKNGDTTTLVAGIPSDLVLTNSLRRFEGDDIVARGTHTGAGCSATLIDSTQDWCNWGVEVGDLVTNTTDCCSTGTITSIVGSTNTITAALTGGTDCDYDACDAYTINTRGSHQCSRAENIRKVRIITDLAVYIKFDGEATSTDHDIQLLAGETYNDDGMRIIARINALNVICAETPQVRWSVWGI